MTQSKRLRQKKQRAAPPPDSDSSEDEANAQIFSVSNGGAVISYHDQLYMLSEVVDDEDEVQELNFQNSSGIRTSARLPAKAWQEMKMYESAPKSARISLQDEEIQLIATSSDEDSASDEEREHFPSLVPAPV